MPVPSTITAILRRYGRIDPAEGPKHRSWQRFEHQAPNDLWQVDFKGHFPFTQGRYPRTLPSSDCSGRPLPICLGTAGLR